jgi:hypothetical protein
MAVPEARSREQKQKKAACNFALCYRDARAMPRHAMLQTRWRNGHAIVMARVHGKLMLPHFIHHSAGRRPYLRETICW